MNKEIKEMVYTTEHKQELLFNDIYKNYHYYIMNLGTHPTAYIEIPKNSKLYGKDYDDINIDLPDLPVNFGLTYSNDSLKIGINTVLENSWFIGWDYAHCLDYISFIIQELEDPNLHKWTTEEIIKECENAIDYILEWEVNNNE